MSERTPIEGQVAKVLNDRELAISVGSEAGVVVGMKFVVLADALEEIRDPISGELLGVMDRPKVYVQATEVSPRFAVCATYKTRVVGGTLSALDAFLTTSAAFAPRREVRETLRADEASRPKPLTPEESYVKIGDRVKEVTE